MILVRPPTEGQKGRLSSTAKVFKVASEVAVVELFESVGDTLGYVKFYGEDIMPLEKHSSPITSWDYLLVSFVRYEKFSCMRVATWLQEHNNSREGTTTGYFS